MAHTVPIRWHHGIPITQADKGRFSMTVRDAWTQLQAAVAHGPVCLVQVQQVQGSAPREVGAWMAVSVGLAPGSLHGLVGSIGGGHLEYQAMAHAQQVLAGRQPHGVQRYALGPSLGQCCGGVVHLAYRVVGVQDLPSLQLRQARRLPVAVFGAGHVGQALVAALQRLPCSMVWVDSRPGLWPDSAVADACTTLVQSDPVQDAVADLPAGSRVVILTHSHVEDWDITAACLARQRDAGDLPFVGLIGSASKWASFRRRLLERGFDAVAVDAVQCPVGIPGIAGKEPEVIAVAIAAQLMQTRALEPS
jgi:xanthine dehydrogenase accessory factor